MRMFRNMRIMKKLMVSFFVVIALIGVILAVSIFELLEVSRLNARIADTRVPTAIESLHISRGVQATLAALRGYSISTSIVL